jgi:biopolymer transport protein ExbD/biopolymer transport protein TolR
MLKISIDKNGQIYVADMAVDLDNFQSVFQSLWQDEAPVVINADETVDYGKVMQVVSLAQAMGVKQLGFLTLDREEKRP